MKSSKSVMENAERVQMAAEYLEDRRGHAKRNSKNSAGRNRDLRIRIPGMIAEIWEMLKATVLSFINDEALSRGAAIAFYTVTSVAPVLLIVVAIAGIAFGHEAAQNSISRELGDLMGQQAAE